MHDRSANPTAAPANPLRRGRTLLTATAALSAALTGCGVVDTAVTGRGPQPDAQRHSAHGATEAKPLPRPGQTIRRTPRILIQQLSVRAETRAGYDRDLFDVWIDADDDCFDTRAEVLILESTKPTKHNDYCTITAGRWVSYYDSVRSTDPGDFDIDHTVPLAEAWDSGAKRWTSRTRRRYGNDLYDPRTLVAVSLSSNRSKSDQDFAEWRPEVNRCRYLRTYTAIKTRWRLAVNPPERRALLAWSTRCPNAKVKVTIARVYTRS